MFKRLLNLSKSNSFFLFGARGTGKTTLIESLYSNKIAHRIDLLQNESLAQLQMRPDSLNEIVARANKEWIIIDEVQKVPALLDQVHALIESRKQKFILTGSSARKLRRGAANLLAGRAFVFNLFPLTYHELGTDFNLDQVLSYGSLPKVIGLEDARDRKLFLKSYTETYLREEILIEQLIRKLPPFRKFLELSAYQDTELVSYSNIARDVLVDPKIISNYYKILEDTLLGFFIEPYHTSIRKRQRLAPKFYWFDLGVRRALAGTIDSEVTSRTYEYGSLFESFIVNEIYRLLMYSEKSFKLSFIRIDDNFEIDLVIERAGLPIFLIEIKSTDRVNPTQIKTLRDVSKEIKGSIPLLISNDPVEKKIDGVSCLYWKNAFKEIGFE